MERRNVPGGVIFGNLFFMNGMCSLGETLEEEIRSNMTQLEDMLSAQGASLKDVLSATVYLKDLNDRERTLNRLWQEYFPENRPARTCVEAGIGKCRCEITLIAALPKV